MPGKTRTVLMFGVFLFYAVVNMSAKDAFSIGGVMKSCGAADKIFGLLSGVSPEEICNKNGDIFYSTCIFCGSMCVFSLLENNRASLMRKEPNIFAVMQAKNRCMKLLCQRKWK